MSADSFVYDFETMTEAHDEIRAALRFFDTVRGDIETLLARLATTWTSGKAAEAYQAYQGDWVTIFVDIIDELSALGADVERARQNAQDAEAINTSIWNGGSASR